MSEDDGDNAPRPVISYTRGRTTTKTRNAASLARRRRNVPLCLAYGGGGEGDGGRKDRHSWFARKSAGWTDDEIKAHVTSGGTSEGGKSFAMVGDVIMGDGPKKEKRAKAKRCRGPRFAWEEAELESGDGDGSLDHGGCGDMGRMMLAAPKLLDIMDEKDQNDFMSPLKVAERYQMKESMIDEGECTDDDRRNVKQKRYEVRRQNAALAELAQVSGVGSDGEQPAAANGSIGWSLLRMWGYRQRLGLAFVPLSGHAGGNDNVDSEVKEMLDHDEKASSTTCDAKWLASKRLRAVPLPSVCQDADDSKRSRKKLLKIPPPKMNRHGIGYDPFKNAPEFRTFHEQRRALAQKRGRGDQSDFYAKGDKKGDKKGRDKWRQALWEKSHDNDNDEDEDDVSDNDISISKGKDQHSHYAADRDFSDFIGTKASSGFALEDDDDADIYHDGGRLDAFPGGEGGSHGKAEGRYVTEVQSPAVSDEEGHGLVGGLFGKSEIKGNKREKKGERVNDYAGKGKFAEAWTTWGMGHSDVAGATSRAATIDGKPPLSGFKLSQGKISKDEPTRWRGPVLPTGYTLKRHIFKKEEDEAIARATSIDGVAIGLGLELKRRKQLQDSQQFFPTILPSCKEQKLLVPKKMIARNGAEPNFHAVRESMKNRFVSSAGGESNARDTQPGVKEKDAHNLDQEEWIQVAVAPWMPTRLLCKRWGVPAPSGVAEAAEPAPGMKNQEEEYFRHTVYESIVSSALEGSNHSKEILPLSVKNIGDQKDQEIALETLVEEDNPAPLRTSHEVFQSIFDAESDMDISLSDDDGDKINSVQTSSEPGESAAHHLEEGMKVDNGNILSQRVDVPILELHHNQQRKKEDSSSVASSILSGRHSAEQQGKRRHDDHQSHDESDYTDEDRMKRKKRERHNHRKHHRSRDSYRRIDERRGYDSNGHRRRKKKAKYKHRSHRRRNIEA